MNEHLTAEELLTALKFCKGDLGGSGCISAAPMQSPVLRTSTVCASAASTQLTK